MKLIRCLLGAVLAVPFVSAATAEYWSPLGEAWLGGAQDISIGYYSPSETPVIYVAHDPPPPPPDSHSLYKSTDEAATWTALPGLAPCAVVTEPDNPDIVYKGVYGWGAYKSTDGGWTWVEINQGLDNPLIEALAMDPSDHLTIWAVMNVRPSGCVFKTTDGGTNWENVAPNIMPFYDVVVDPSDSWTAYICTQWSPDPDWRGVFKTTDGGASWVQKNNGLLGPSIGALAIDPRDPDVLFAGNARLPEHQKVYKTENGGDSWFPVLDFYNPPPVDQNCESIVIDPVTGYVYVAAKAVYRSTNGGSNWTYLETGIQEDNIQALAIDPEKTNVVYAGALSTFYKSTDYGETWVQHNVGMRLADLYWIDVNLPYLFTNSDGGDVHKSMDCGYTSIVSLVSPAEAGGGGWQ